MIIKSQISFLKSVLYMAAVIQTGSITKAAERNGIKATNLSKIIKDLEETVGKPLFVRKSNGVIPTEAALLLYDKALQLEMDLKQVQALKVKPGHRYPTLKLYKPSNLSLGFLKEFAHARIRYVTALDSFHIGVFYEKPADLPVAYQVGEYELQINGLSQKLWIACQSENENACALMDFIISKLFP